MQAKISSFFKPTTTTGNRPSRPSRDLDWDEELSTIPPHPSNLDVLVTYSRRTPNPIDQISEECEGKRIGGLENGASKNRAIGSSAGAGCSGKVLNKKRSYAQYHLELGQSDFLLHTCSGCGMMYTCGDESDEKAHKVHHKNYHEGIRFKGWRDERQIPMPWTGGERVILVLDGDPSFQRRKVQEVLKLMERDICSSSEWLLHKHFRVFLFIARSRIAACLIAESITTAYRVIPSGGSLNINEKGDETAKSASPETGTITVKQKRLMPTILQFGNATFYREGKKKYTSGAIQESSQANGALLCSEESTDAICGVRAIWVVPSLRRSGIATRLLDAARRSFITDTVLDTSQIAFSHPTSAGHAFAVSYSGTQSFLVYKS